jgi:hypothetical protein
MDRQDILSCFSLCPRIALPIWFGAYPVCVPPCQNRCVWSSKLHVLVAGWSPICSRFPSAALGSVFWLFYLNLIRSLLSSLHWNMFLACLAIHISPESLYRLILSQATIVQVMEIFDVLKPVTKMRFHVTWEYGSMILKGPQHVYTTSPSLCPPKGSFLALHPSPSIYMLFCMFQHLYF